MMQECPECEGQGWFMCEGCEGTGVQTCSRCGHETDCGECAGEGSWQSCINCGGTGKVTVLDDAP